jgi:hypothetical protein
MTWRLAELLHGHMVPPQACSLFASRLESDVDDFTE